MSGFIVDDLTTPSRDLKKIDEGMSSGRLSKKRRMRVESSSSDSDNNDIYSDQPSTPKIKATPKPNPNITLSALPVTKPGINSFLFF